MQPKLEKLGFDWATFQVLRKTNASLSKKAGFDPKVASDQRGYGLGLSLELSKLGHEHKRAAVKKLESAVLRQPPPENGRAQANPA